RDLANQPAGGEFVDGDRPPIHQVSAHALPAAGQDVVDEVACELDALTYLLVLAVPELWTQVVFGAGLDEFAGMQVPELMDGAGRSCLHVPAVLANVETQILLRVVGQVVDVLSAGGVIQPEKL